MPARSTCERLARAMGQSVVRCTEQSSGIGYRFVYLGGLCCHTLLLVLKSFDSVFDCGWHAVGPELDWSAK